MFIFLLDDEIWIGIISIIRRRCGVLYTNLSIRIIEKLGGGAFALFVVGDRMLGSIVGMFIY